MKVCEKERKEGNQLYVEGLKRYQERGIRVLIDGEDASDATWDKLFEVREVFTWVITSWKTYRRTIQRQIRQLRG